MNATLGTSKDQLTNILFISWSMYYFFAPTGVRQTVLGVLVFLEHVKESTKSVIFDFFFSFLNGFLDINASCDVITGSPRMHVNMRSERHQRVCTEMYFYVLYKHQETNLRWPTAPVNLGGLLSWLAIDCSVLWDIKLHYKSCLLLILLSINLSQ